GDTLGAITGALRLMGDTALALVAVFVVFAVLDVPLQRFFFLRKQRMTRQERKEEHKQQEGRPEVKGRIRQLQRQMAQRQVTRVIDQADVVIVNPEHYAVALRYDPQRARAPYVIARGVDETALYIRQLATARGLEVLEAPPLARALYFTTQVNQQIPAPLYGAVAQVLHYILQLRAWRQGRRARPVPPQHFPIPDDLLKRG
ncbi:EscU/YscU/HrcU family type III secretion system export apparatus switch protein, partial [Pseudomonas otitidis]